MPHLVQQQPPSNIIEFPGSLPNVQEFERQKGPPNRFTWLQILLTVSGICYLLINIPSIVPLALVILLAIGVWIGAILFVEIKKEQYRPRLFLLSNSDTDPLAKKMKHSLPVMF